MHRHVTLLLVLCASITAGASATALAQKPSKEQVKVNVYVEMLNTWSPFMSKGWDGYTAWADVKAGPSCTEKGIRGPSSLGSSAPKTFGDFKKALKKKPKLEADAAAMAMAEALDEIREPIADASSYYNKREYKKDECKRGKELHAALIASWTKYFEGERVVRKFVVTYNDARAIKDLAKTKKKYGKKNRYHYEKLILDGKTLIRTLDEQSRQKEPDVAAIQSDLDTFKATQVAAAALVEKASKRDASVLYQGGYKQMATHYAVQYAGAVERLIKQYGKRAEPRFNEKNLETDLKNAFGSYNRMIDAANKVRFSKAIK